MGSITVEELKQLVDRGGPQILLDVREEWEYGLCKIDGSINIPMSEISNRLDELDPNSDIIVICHHGNRSFQVACYLENSGVGKIIMNLEEGINAWAERIDNNILTY